MSFLKRIFGTVSNAGSSTSETSENSGQAMSERLLDLPQFIQMFLTAPTLTECRRLIIKNPDLLTEETELMMTDMGSVAPEHARKRMDERIALFRLCREAGVEIAFEKGRNK